MKFKTLSKTRFKLALECQTKVFYSLDKCYANQMQDDEFLEALAQGGHQVGALAKLMFQAEDPDAIEITSKDQDEQVRETEVLLRRANVTIFEATIRHENLLVRVDVLTKRGRRVDLIEVKAKSWDPSDDSLIGDTPRKNPLTPEWEAYVYDIAFQERVFSLAYTDFEIRPFLMLVDKSRPNTVAGLPLYFEIKGQGRDRTVVVSPDFHISNLKESILVQVDAREAVNRAQNLLRKRKDKPDINFDTLIATTAAAIQRDEQLGPFVSSQCKSCQFYCAPADRTEEVRSGWAECMETYFGKPVQGPREESVFGFYRRADTNGFVEARKLWMRDLQEADLKARPAPGKISDTERHALQWREIKDGDKETVLEVEALREAMGGWKFPLHFIDFETTTPALPFHVGHRPYQPVLFQFSHHIVQTDGTVVHATECLLAEAGGPPSIEVVRRLRDGLGDGDSTVLHWYPHERTILAAIRQEIEATNPADQAELVRFLEGMGLEKDAHRRLFDLGRLVANQVFLPGTGGSSSMKKFLPAVLQHSQAVRTRYERPIYGTATMPSHNFHDQTWAVEHEGKVLDPYKLLSPLFGEHELDEALARLEVREGEVVANGAAAMIAYGRLQDSGLPAEQRAGLRQQLLRYCELDTLAMVMVYEALTDWVRDPAGAER